MLTWARVLADEGWASGYRRLRERLGETVRAAGQRWRGALNPDARAPLLNVCGWPPANRFGGVPIQLAARLAAEAQVRPVALYTPGWLQVDGRGWPVASLTEALTRTAAAAVHVEGTHGLDLEALLALPQRLLLSLHDLELAQSVPAPLRDGLLARAVAIVYPSAYLAEVYGRPGTVIAPATAIQPVTRPHTVDPHAIAVVGAMKRHKGAALLPALIARAGPDLRWHLYGGGDAERLLRPLRQHPQVQVHGYLAASQMPQALCRARIALAVLPSLVAESHSLALSDCWQAGVPAIGFDQGALGARIQAMQGPDWLAPAGSGVEGLLAVLARWHSGGLATPVLSHTPDASEAARAMRQLYARLDMAAA